MTHNPPAFEPIYNSEVAQLSPSLVLFISNPIKDNAMYLNCITNGCIKCALGPECYQNIYIYQQQPQPQHNLQRNYVPNNH